MIMDIAIIGIILLLSIALILLFAFIQVLIQPHTQPEAPSFPYENTFDTSIDFDSVLKTTDGTDKSGDFSVSGGSLLYSATGSYVVGKKDLGSMPKYIRVNFISHNADGNFQIGIIYGADWDADPDYAGGMIARAYVGGQDKLFCGVMSAAGEPTITNTSSAFSALTDDAAYYLIFTLTDHGDDTSDIDVELFNGSDVSLKSLAMTPTSNTAFTTEFCLMLYNFTGGNIEITSWRAYNS